MHIHKALPWEEKPSVGDSPPKSTMVAHASSLLRCVSHHCFPSAASHLRHRFWTLKASPWKSEFSEMGQAGCMPLYNSNAPLTPQQAAAEEYEIYKRDATKIQSELVQAAEEWVEQNFGGHPVTLPSEEFLQCT